ncbi:Serine/threonine-protein kinase PknL [Enhygromyxa salina]|uniref:Serine/threonine-protein kinase PknL n=1 Tax=Enhygromyxa salina TaxID=215803 RepID=A0A2S9XXV5_9BACT|nr:serine/threonine-protein kinase [Enhygromyxa salina]PRP97673.1 Serine/threonine-protein kinase PknL [Enhygromyxa salina]
MSRAHGRSPQQAAEVAALAERVAATWADEAGPRFVRLGRYQLDREIGRGTFGVVFAGFDCALEREVAVKVFHVGAPGRALAVEREARALARVAHPNVVALHDLGRVGEHAYLVMDFVEGWSLAERMRMPIGWRAITLLFVQAGRGLAAAHRAGLEHGDVKPGNILVGPDGRVQVVDFGLARLLHETARPEPSKRGGTRCYAAPEWLFEGQSDARSDQFSFCVSLWEALFGQRPWAREGVEYEAMLVEVVEPAKRRSLAGVPAQLECVLRRGLAARPGDRFATMDEVADALTLAVIGSEQRRSRRQARIGVGAAAAISMLVAAKLLMPAAAPAKARPKLPGKIVDVVGKFAPARAVVGDVGDPPARERPARSRETRARDGAALPPRVDPG